MSNRKTGKELRKEYLNLSIKTKALEQHIIERAEDLIVRYPHVRYSDAMWQCDEYVTISSYKKYYAITPEIGLKMIELVEAYIASLHPHQQGRFMFS